MKTLAVVAAIVVVVAVVAFYLLSRGDTNTALDLNGTVSTCTIVTTAANKDVSVKKNNKVTWTVTNACPAAQTVMLGNFRTLQASTPPTCADPTEGGAAWPFKDQDQNNRSVTVAAGQSDNIILKEAKNAGSTALTYFFDVCVGGVKMDPRLVIEP
jgi:hypothetical protein